MPLVGAAPVELVLGAGVTYVILLAITNPVTSKGMRMSKYTMAPEL